MKDQTAEDDDQSGQITETNGVACYH